MIIAPAWQSGDAPAPVGTLPFHPIANLFPLIEGEAFDELVDDVAVNGLQDPIELLDGAILDGRNRYRAALAAGVTVHTRQFKGADPLGYVISKNMHRRHLDESQRAMVAAALASLERGRPSANNPSSEGISTDKAAALMRVGHASVERAKTVREQGVAELVHAVESGRVSVTGAADLAALPLAEQKRVVESLDPRALAGAIRQVRERKTAEKKARRTEREAALAMKQRSLPDRRYGVIYSDCEWRFEPYSRDSGMDRAADNHYPTTSTNDLVLRDVGRISAKDCVLFHWATAAMLKAAIRVMEGWGFEYKSHFIWLKDRTGTGYWNRNKHELLLVGTRGDIPAPAMGEQWPSVIEAPVGAHSAKPEIFAEMIEAYYPNLPKIELNARRARPGWDVWGLEAPEVAS